MKVIWIPAAGFLAAAIMIAQQNGQPPAAGRTKAAPRDRGQSPASRQGPRTVTAQTYSSEEIRNGEVKFASQCGFCHGRDAAGGETGPDLTRSQLVAEDNRGDKIEPLVRAGIPDKGMPAFAFTAADLSAIIAFIHDQKTKSESLAGGRRSVDAEDLASGDAEAGRNYFNGAGGCSRCHSPSGDLAGISSRYDGLALLRRMLYPSGQPAPKPPTITLTLGSGETIVGSLTAQDEFTLIVQDAAGKQQTYGKTSVSFKIDDPLTAHFDQLGKYTDADMHNVFAYLNTLK
ncbi:MAG: c-type cytochrome [Acidobacteriia bacterium]|nr:c-type cytochrome [Terriglobia bacterium]MBV8904849.1 c-type cytochrome [Terriglobia bacterium]